MIMVGDDLYLFSDHGSERWNTITQTFTIIPGVPYFMSCMSGGQPIYLRHLHAILIIKNPRSDTVAYPAYKCGTYDINSNRWYRSSLRCPFYQKNSTFLLLGDGDDAEPATTTTTSSLLTLPSSSPQPERPSSILVAIVPPNQLWVLPTADLSLSGEPPIRGDSIVCWQPVMTCNDQSLLSSLQCMVCSF
jgi:hypothetical protein